MLEFKDFKILSKGDVPVISSDPSCKDYNARFTTKPLEAFRWSDTDYFQ